MKQIRDINKKRVCDLSDDKKTAYISKGDCVTEIRVAKDAFYHQQEEAKSIVANVQIK